MRSTPRGASGKCCQSALVIRIFRRKRRSFLVRRQRMFPISALFVNYAHFEERIRFLRIYNRGPLESAERFLQLSLLLRNLPLHVEKIRLIRIAFQRLRNRFSTPVHSLAAPSASLASGSLSSPDRFSKTLQTPSASSAPARTLRR